MTLELKPFANAPIVEAIFDIRVSHDKTILFDDLLRFVEAVKDSYPVTQKIHKLQAQLKAGGINESDEPQITHETTSQPLGYQCLSKNQKQIIQARTNGLTYSRLKPYDCWTTFQAEARRLFELYCMIFGECKIDRIAIRTVNRLDIPHAKVDFKEWLRTGPEVSPDLPQDITGFFMQIKQHYQDIASDCIINETLITPETPETISVILDIELFRTHDISQDTDQFWALTNQMRNKKNEIFLGCITKKMREVFT